MAEVMKIWLSLSLSGGMMILVLWLGRTWFKERFSRRWQYYIWLLVIARLWIPLAPEQNLVGSFFRGLDLAGSWARETVEDMDDTLSYKNSPEWIEKHPQPEADDEAGPVTAVTETRNPEPAAWLTGLPGRLRKGFSAVTRSFGFIWLAVAGFLLIYKMSVYRRFSKTLRAGWTEPDDMTVLEHFGKMVELSRIRRVVRLYTNPQIASPLLIGFFHPCIVLPDINMPEEAFTYTIHHELTHLKRGDMFYKWLVQVTLCLHWFNPLVYLMERVISRECELSCDEAVIRRLDEHERRAYGDTLLNAAVSVGYQNHLASVTLCEGKELLKERLGAIRSYKKRSKMLTAATVAFTVVLTAGAVSMGAYAATENGNTYGSGSGQWASRNADGKVTYSYRQDGYYEAPYIIELGWNLSESASASYSGKVDLTLNSGDVVSASFDRSCAAYSTDEKFLPAFTSLLERLSDKKLNSHFPFRLERPLVQSVQDVSGRNLAELADEFYKEEKLTSFNAIFPELDTESKGSLCEKIYTDGRISFFSSAVNHLGADLLNQYAKRAYQDENITFFADIAWNLSGTEVSSYAKRAFDDGKNTFFSELLPYLPEKEVKNYAENAYQTNRIATFTIVAAYLSNQDKQAFAERAEQDGKITFYSVLSDRYE